VFRDATPQLPEDCLPEYNSPPALVPTKQGRQDPFRFFSTSNHLCTFFTEINVLTGYPNIITLAITAARSVQKKIGEVFGAVRAGITHFDQQGTTSGATL
jgi:hypothetical protein